ncbi:MAG: DUF1304 family protein [Pseudomonadota bacterium]
MSIAEIAVVALGIIHLGAFYKEVFDAKGLAGRVAGIDIKEVDNASPASVGKILALVQNQGVYNAFIGVGLLLTLTQVGDAARAPQLYLSACVVVAGLFGGRTVSPILYLQAAIGAVVLAIVWFA